MTIKMQTVDMSWYRFFRAVTWRGYFFEAAETAARRVSEYSCNRGDYDNGARWKSRELFIREYAKRALAKDDNASEDK
jgi:hypothetical protein